MKLRIIVFLIVGLVCTLEGFGQKRVDSMLIGSWELIDHKENEKTLDLGSRKEVMSFYNNKNFQQTIKIRIKKGVDSFSFIGGSWTVNKKKVLKFSDIHKASERDVLKPSKLDFEIVSIDNNSMVLSFGAKRIKESVSYKKVPWAPMFDDAHGDDDFFPSDKTKKDEIVITYSYPVDSSEEYKKQNKIYLVNSLDTHKRIRLRPTGEFELVTSFNLYGYQQFEVNLTGDIDSLNKSGLFYKVNQSYTVIRQKNGHQSYNNEYFVNCADSVIQGDTANKKFVNRAIAMESIKYLNYRSPGRSVCNNMGPTILTLSGLTALIVAPLVSINYKNGDFNSKTYYKWAGIGLIGAGVSIPLFIVGQSKSYNITLKNKMRSKNYWYFENANPNR